MPEKTKKDEEPEKEKRENEDAENWSEDQKNRSYYYDDSYGYEIYNPDEDEDNDELIKDISLDSPINPTKL